MELLDLSKIFASLMAETSRLQLRWCSSFTLSAKTKFLFLLISSFTHHPFPPPSSYPEESSEKEFTGNIIKKTGTNRVPVKVAGLLKQNVLISLECNVCAFFDKKRNVFC